MVLRVPAIPGMMGGVKILGYRTPLEVVEDSSPLVGHGPSVPGWLQSPFAVRIETPFSWNKPQFADKKETWKPTDP